MSKRYVGVDLHTNSITACYFKDEETMLFKTFKLTKAGLRCFKQSLRASDELAIEATGNSAYFADAVRDCVARLVVLNPRQFRVIRDSVAKTDKNDARAIAYFLSKDMLPASRQKAKSHRDIASLSQTRDKLVKTRTFFMNKIHGLLNGAGIKLKRESLGSKKGLNRVLGMEVDEVTGFEVEVLVNQVRAISESIKQCDEKLIELGRELTGFDNLSSIKGIGERSASVLLSAIGNIDDFADEGKLASYFGIVPKVSQSNETEHHGRIHKRGNKLARTTLVQCALVAMRYNEVLKDFHSRIRARRGGAKANIALAKKFLGIIFKTLKNNWVFTDFPNFVLVNS